MCELSFGGDINALCVKTKAVAERILTACMVVRWLIALFRQPQPPSPEGGGQTHGVRTREWAP